MPHYQTTLDFLYSQLPMYQRIGPAAYKNDLGNTHAIMQALGHPGKALKYIHIAGTNGKGSVSHMLASVLQEAGYKTGLYTSPHLTDFRERIKINGSMIPKDEVCLFVDTYRDHFLRIRPSFFEMTVGMAFWYFEKENIDIAVLETGLGGRLDSTNIVTPELALITNIGHDHMHFLGNSLSEIATEKAGIIKKGVDALIGESNPETNEVFRKIAAERNSPLHFASELCSICPGNMDAFQMKFLSGSLKHAIEVSLPLQGNYQQNNLRTAGAAIALLMDSLKLREVHIKKGIEKVVHNTGLRGRWQKISDHPLTICDIGHNMEGIMMITEQLKSSSYNKLHIVFGMVEDKEAGEILKLLPKDAQYYFCKANVPRALDNNILANKAEACGLSGISIPSVKEALKIARAMAADNDMIFVGGSTFVVAEVL